MYEHYCRIKKVFGNNMILIYTDTDSLKTCIRRRNVYIEVNKIIEHFDTSNFDMNTDKLIKLGLNKKVLGVLFENSDKPIKIIIPKALKTYIEICENGYEIKAKGLKNGFKKEVNNTLITEKPHQLKEKQIVSRELNVSIEETFKDVIPVLTNKRETYLGLNKTIPWGYKGKKYQSLLHTFKNNHPPSKNK